jgi:hypothetical protein
MAVFNGTKMLLVVDGVTMGASEDFTLNINASNIKYSSKDSGNWAYRLYGEKDWDVSFSNLCDPSLTFNVEEIFDILDAETRVFLEMAVIDGTGGGLKFSGYALGKNLSLSAKKNEAVSINGGFEADGPIDKGTVASS